MLKLGRKAHAVPNAVPPTFCSLIAQLQKAIRPRSHDRAPGRVVGIHADSEGFGFLGRVDDTRAGGACHCEVDIRLLIDGSEGVLLARRRVGECAGKALEHP
jgi:hypothetical protein